MSHEYPKALYKGSDVSACLADCTTVHDADQEAAARKDGYEMYAEIHARADEPEAHEKRAYHRKAK